MHMSYKHRSTYMYIEYISVYVCAYGFDTYRFIY